MLTLAVLIKTYNCKLEKAQRWLPYLQAAIRLCEVDQDKNRLACFLAQIGEESGSLRYTRELWGPTKQQLRYEPGTQLAQQLGNIYPGDGKLFMGRGLIQTTGRGNYRLTTLHMTKALQETTKRGNDYPEAPDFEKEPTQLENPLWAALSAAVYWQQKKLNRYCDAHDFVTLTRRINGGLTHLAQRQAFFASAFSALLSQE